MLESAIDSKLTNFLERFSGKKDPDELLTRLEACEVLKIDLSTLHLWRKADRIKAHAIGSRIYFKRSEIEAALTPVSK